MNTESTKTHKLLTAMVGLQIFTLLGLWTAQPQMPRAAAIPDPGAQREAQVAEQKATNQKLDQLIELLRSGKLKVKVEAEDKK